MLPAEYAVFYVAPYEGGVYGTYTDLAKAFKVFKDRSTPYQDTYLVQLLDSHSGEALGERIDF
jgi:hypothetical protein